MAISKTAKIDAEIIKKQAKIAELQNEVKGLQQKRRDAENMEIVDIVRGLKIPLDQLSAFLESIKTGGATSGQVVPKLENDEELEDDAE